MIGTHENILNSFFKLAQKGDFPITIYKIAREAKMSKQAIYRKHFKCVADIINEIHSILYKEVYYILKTFDKNNDLNKQLANELLPRIYKYHDWINILYQTDVDPTWKKFIKEQYLPLLLPYVNQIKKKMSVSSEFAQNYLLYSYITIISSWLCSPLPQPPKIFAKRFLRIINYSLIEILN